MIHDFIFNAEIPNANDFLNDTHLWLFFLLSFNLLLLAGLIVAYPELLGIWLYLFLVLEWGVFGGIAWKIHRRKTRAL
jgi:hypothetical protein